MDIDMLIQETEIALEIQADKCMIAFGKKNAQFSQLQKNYEQFQFHRIKQNHGDIIFSTKNQLTDYQETADAQITKATGLALCISTADCIPVMIYCPKSKMIAAIHAGWRGVANQIVMKTISKMFAMGGSASSLKVYIGPHIQQQSFEVGKDVCAEILKSVNLELNECGLVSESAQYFSLGKDGKYLMNLDNILLRQLRSLAIEEEHIFHVHIDTYRDERFHSHRRDRENAGRQLSFIVLRD